MAKSINDIAMMIQWGRIEGWILCDVEGTKQERKLGECSCREWETSEWKLCKKSENWEGFRTVSMGNVWISFNALWEE